MNINEIICESIDLAEHEPLVRKAVNSFISVLLKHVRDYVASTQDESMFMSYNQFMHALKQQRDFVFLKYANHAIRKIAKLEDINHEITVYIDTHTNSNAYATLNVSDKGRLLGHKLAISEEFLSLLVQSTLNSIWDIYQRMSGNKLVNVINVYVQDPTVSKKVQRRVRDMSGTIIHEMVHVVQNDIQLVKKRRRMEYRSYLNPDAENFQQNVRSNAMNFTHYMASPQEITAFAHEAVLEILEDPSDLDSSKIQQHVDSMLKRQKVNLPELKKYGVYQRYLKRVYQVLIQRLKTLKGRTGD